MTYHATDEDLPDIFFHPVTVEKEEYRTEESKNVNALMLHYPEWAMSELEKQRRRWERRGSQDSHAKEQKEDRRKYIKSAKVQQMRDWLNALKEVRLTVKANATKFERAFLNDLYVKFKKYAVVKWVTQKQYDTLAHIAAQYVKLPGR